MTDSPTFEASAAFRPDARKIDPTLRPSTSLSPLGSASDSTGSCADEAAYGPTDLAFDEWRALGLTPPDLNRMRADRLARLRKVMADLDLAGALFFDPLNIRYATDSSNMQIWTTHNPARAAFVALDGPVVLWDFHGSEHLTKHLPLIDEVRHGASFFYMESGELCDAHARRFAADVSALLKTHGGGSQRLGVDRVDIPGVRALDAAGIEILSGQRAAELARLIKTPEEVRAMRCAIASCEAAMADMRRALRPGVSEAELWAALHYGNIIRGGEWIETRILSSGPRTNPWFQECGARRVQAGELVAFDTDLIGPFGFCADLSRTWYCAGPGFETPTAEQRNLHQVAHDFIAENGALLGPGVSFRDLTYLGAQLPPAYRRNRYGVRFHGVGLCDEFPSIRYAEDYEDGGFPKEAAALAPGMTLCVEVYIGAEGGREGVKLEDQWLITEDGAENLTRAPFDPLLMD